MDTGTSRRWFVAAIGGVAAAAASTTMVWRWRGPATTSRPGTHVTDSPGYVDHNGWIVTPADQARLLSGAVASDAAQPRASDGTASER